MRGLLFGLVLVALASACLAEPQDRLLEVSSLARLHQRVNVGAGRKAGSHAPPLTPEAPVHVHDDDDHSGSPSASLKSSTSSITLKEPIDSTGPQPQGPYSVIENATPHIHNNLNNIVNNHNRNIAAEKRRLLIAGDLGEAEIQAVHAVLDKLFPEEANLEHEAKEFELDQPIPPAKVTKLPKAPKAEKETKKRHGFSEGSVAYLTKIWLDNKSVSKLRTYYTNRVASAIDQLQQSKDLLFKPELKPTPRKRAATEAFLAFELRHRARLVTRWAQDVSEDKCQIKLVATARKRDLRTYGSRDGPTFELLVGRKIKSMQKACKKQSKKLKNNNKKEKKNKNKNKNEKKEHEEQLGPFTDDDFVKLYNSIVSSARRPNRFLNLFLRIKKAKKTEKKPAERDVDEGLDGKHKMDPASSEPIDADHADTCTLVEKQGMIELQQMMDSVELELIEDPEEHEVCAFTPAKKHDL